MPADCTKAQIIVTVVALVVVTAVVVSIAVGVTLVPKDPKDDKASQPLCTAWKSGNFSAKCFRFQCPPTVLISFDGFRYDYLNRNVTPTFKRVMENGVSAPFMRPAYPSSTFPNHYTIATGLYPESHGIVDNRMYDPVLNKNGSVGPEYLNSYWWSGEPIWNTVQKIGKRSAVMYWPGSEASINGVRPTYWHPYNKDKPFEERVQQVLDWIKISDNSRPDLIHLYFNEPDGAGHSYGPNSEQVTKWVKNVDSQLKLLLDGLSKEDILDCVNIVVVADHGMADYTQTSYFDVSTRINNLNDYVYFASSNSRLRSNTGEAPDETIRRLGCDDHVQMYKKQDLPIRLHYAANRRIEPVIMMPDEGWYTADSPPAPDSRGGGHGWDNSLASMQAIFMAMGPYFKRNYISYPFENIEVYSLLCTLMDVPPAPNNGTAGSLSHLLRYSVDQPQPKQYLSVPCSTGSSPPANACQRPAQPAFPERVVSLDTGTCFIDFNSNFRSHFNIKRRLLKFLQTRESIQWREIKAQDITNMCVDGQVLPQYQLLQNDWTNLTANPAVTPVLLQWPGVATNMPSTLLVPMYKAFLPYWTALISVVNQGFSTGSDLVLMGPIFDHDSDGKADPVSSQLIPSHYFVSVIRGERASRDDITSWILPHRSTYTSCRNESVWLSRHVARLRDIELLTEMTFFFNQVPNTELRLHLPPQSSVSQPVSLCGRWKQNAPAKCSKFLCPPVIIISLDGFRADYLTRNVSPTLDRIMKNGVSAAYMRPAFPSKTFPNHYAIVTGMYPESHQVVDNTMYDPLYNLSVKTELAEFLKPYWWGGDPVWNTVQKSKKISGTYFWPGTGVNISGMYPTYWFPYNDSTPFSTRIQQVLDWLDLPNEMRPDSINVYLEEPDAAGHTYGPSNANVTRAVGIVDSYIQSLIAGLEQRNILDCVNLIIVSDHGMADVSCDNYFDISSKINNTKNYFMTFNAASRIRSLIGEPPEETIRRLGCDDHVQFFKKEDLPARYHYVNHRRIDPVVLIPQEGWITGITRPTSCGGNHGWDNQGTGMRAIFMGMGPYFKSNYKSHPFENIEVYNLLCNILDIPPSPNNGTDGSLDHLLTMPIYRPNIQLPVITACSPGTGAPASACPARSPATFTQRVVTLNSATCAIDINSDHRVYYSTDRRLLKAVFTRQPIQYRQQTIPSICLDGQVPAQKQLSLNDWNNVTSQPNVIPAFMHWTGDATNAPSTLLVPMYRAFIPYWTALISMVNQGFTAGSDLVMMGPLFDYNLDGRDDPIANMTTSIPSHFFMSVIRGERLSRDDITSWVVPNRASYTLCRNETTWLRLNIARLRDIELLTSMTFFFNQTPNYELRLHLPPLS